jgi:hypothetical protein
MKTKEQILEKIMRRDARVEKTYTDPHDLASYLATIEERLEKVEGEEKSFEKCMSPKGNEVCTDGRYTYHEWNEKFSERGCPYCRPYPPSTPTEGETKHRCSTKCRVDCKLRAPTPTPPECEHKHRGLYGECLKCTAKFDDSPTEVKDWEDEFTQNWVGLKITPLVSDEIKSFIRNLLNK